MKINFMTCFWGDVTQYLVSPNKKAKYNYAKAWIQIKREYWEKFISPTLRNHEFFYWIICFFCPFSLKLIDKFINLNQYIVVCETYEWW